MKCNLNLARRYWTLILQVSMILNWKSSLCRSNGCCKLQGREFSPTFYEIFCMILYSKKVAAFWFRFDYINDCFHYSKHAWWMETMNLSSCSKTKQLSREEIQCTNYRTTRDTGVRRWNNKLFPLGITSLNGLTHTRNESLSLQLNCKINSRHTLSTLQNYHNEILSATNIKV